MTWQDVKLTRAIAIYCYPGQSSDKTLNFFLGDILIVTKKNCEGWCYGYLENQRDNLGIFPESFINYIDEKKICSFKDVEHSITEHQRYLHEVEDLLFEWHSIILPFFINDIKIDKTGRNVSLIFQLITRICDSRAEIKSQPVMTPVLIEENRLKISRDIDKVVELLKLDKIPRTKNGQIVNPKSISPIELYRIFEPRDERRSFHLLHSKTEENKHIYDLKVCIKDNSYEEFNKLSTIEILFSLFDRNDYDGKLSEDFITEKFKILYNQESDVKDKEFIFRDLNSIEKSISDDGKTERQRDLYLVIQLIKRDFLNYGPIRTLEKSKTMRDMSSNFRQPFAASATTLQFITDLPDRSSRTIKVQFDLSNVSTNNKIDNFSSKNFIFNDKLDQSSFFELEFEITKLVKDFDLINLNMAELDPNVDIQKMAFPDIMMPDHLRNDVYIRLEEGKFLKNDKKITRSSIEIVASVRTDTSVQLENCISVGAGSENSMSDYHSIVYYHCTSPKWYETFKVSFNKNNFKILSTSKQVHVLFEFYNIISDSKKSEKELAAFAFLELADGGQISADGRYELIIYDVPKNERSTLFKSDSYLKNESLWKEKSEKKTPQSLYFQTSIKWVTNKLVQNRTLAGFLQSNRTTSMPKDMKTKIFEIPDQDLVYHMSDVLDAIFAGINKTDRPESIMDTSPRIYEPPLLFRFLIQILWTITNEKWSHYLGILESYIDYNFSKLELTEYILDNISKMLSKSPVDELQRLSYVFYWLMKFTVRSHVLTVNYPPNNQMELSNGFIPYIRHIFTILVEYSKRITKPEINPNSRTRNPDEDRFKDSKRNVGICLMRAIAKCWPVFMSAEDRDELQESYATDLAQSYCNFLNFALDKQAEVHREWDSTKIICICQIIEKQEFEKYVAVRKIVLDTAVDVTNVSFYKCQSNTLKHESLIMIGKIFTSLYQLKREKMKNISTELSHIIQKIVPLLIDCIKSPEDIRRSSVKTVFNPRLNNSNIIEHPMIDFEGKKSPEYESMFCSLATIFQLMEERHFTEFYTVYLHQQDKKFEHTLSIFLKKIYFLVTNWYDIKNTWASLKFVLADTFVMALSKLFPVISKATVRKDILTNFCTITMELMNSDFLQIESCSQRKQSEVMRNYGDIREKCLDLFLNMWNKANSSNILTIEVVDKLMKLIIENSFMEKFSNKLIPCFMAIMKIYRENEKGLSDLLSVFKPILADLILKNPNIKEGSWLNLKEILEQEYKLTNFSAEAESFVISIFKISLHLIHMRDATKDKDDGFYLCYLICAYNIVKEYNFEEEMYRKVISEIYTLHKSNKDYTEAGFTKLEYAKKLSFHKSKKMSGKIFDLKDHQPQNLRKEVLYLNVIEDLNMGKEWEEAIALCKELIQYYEETYQYEKLPNILKKEAEYYQAILSQKTEDCRTNPNFYVVCLYGKPVPKYLRGQYYIYKCHGFFTRTDLVNFIGKNFNSHVSKNISEQFDEEVWLNSDQVLIRYAQVAPVMRPSELEKCKSVPHFVQQYYRFNKISTFSHDVSFYKGQRNKENEHMNCFYDRTYYEISSHFPGMSTWYPVCRKTKEELPPVKVAIDSLRNKCLGLNEELLLASTCSREKIEGSRLLMQLNGVVLAAVNGGPLMYLDFLAEDGDNMLNETYSWLLQIIKQALDFFFRICNPHDERKNLFEKGLKDMQTRVDAKLEELGKDKTKSHPPIVLRNQALQNYKKIRTSNQKIRSKSRSERLLKKSVTCNSEYVTLSEDFQKQISTPVEVLPPPIIPPRKSTENSGHSAPPLPPRESSILTVDQPPEIPPR